MAHVRYKQNLALGDKYFKEERWKEAKLAYSEALKYKPEDVHLQDKIRQCRINISRRIGEVFLGIIKSVIEADTDEH